MKNPVSSPWFKAVAAVVVGVIIVVGIVAAKPILDRWWKPADNEPAAREQGPKSHELVRDEQGRPVNPPALRLSEEAARTLGITPQNTEPAKKATQPRPLPPLEGTLAYENDNLFPVRSRFAGEVVAIKQVPRGHIEAEAELALPSSERYAHLNRPLGFGDKVKKGELLAVVWSKDLGTMKGTLIDAMIDLRRDQQRLKELEKLYQEGAISAATFYEAQRTVQHDYNAVNSADRTLRIWKLDDQEIADIKQEAATIEVAKRDPKKEKDWARVEVRAPHDGTIVEKNTNVGDWVDPSNGNPMFRIADLETLAVWVHPLEEYLPILNRLSENSDTRRLYWQIRLLAEEKASPLEGPILRVAPSVDPVNRTLLVMGRIANPKGRLLSGLSASATIFVQPQPNLVEIKTTALNEDNGQSIVFVQPTADRNEYVLRRVAVAERFKDVVFVRSKLTAEDEQRSRADVANELRPIEPLRPGERVVTQGVTMMTVALRDLLAKETMTKGIRN